MMRYLAFTNCLLLLVLLSDPAFAQVASHGVIDQVTVRRMGLQRAWVTHLEGQRTGGQSAQTSLFISADQRDIVHEIYSRGRHLLFTSRDVNESGKPVGQEGVKAAARRTLMSLRRLGQDPKHTTREVPEVTLYVQSGGSILQAIDGENGRKLWSIPIGKRGYPNFTPAINEDSVAIVNGSTLYIVDRLKGELRWFHQLSSAPWAGPAISSTMVFVPLVNGIIESYYLDEPDRRPWLVRSAGRASTRPTIATNTISWSTDQNYFYVGGALDGRIRYRLKTNSDVVSPSSFLAPNVLLAAARRGDIYALEELNGEVLWRYSSGEDVRQSPIPIGKAVYVVSILGRLTHVAADTGLEQWHTDGVQRILAVSETRIYCRGDHGSFLVIDAGTGQLLHSVNMTNVDVSYINSQTDRVYLGTSSGIFQCLYERERTTPMVHVTLQKKIEAPVAPETDETPEADGDEEPAEPEPVPLDRNEDPFQVEGDEEPAMEEDPLREDEEDDENPFG